MEFVEFKYNNIAGRMWSVLVRASEAKADLRTHAVWRRLFDGSQQQTPHNETPSEQAIVGIYRNLATMSLSLQRVEEQVQATFPDEAEILLRHFPALQKAISPPNLMVRWEEYKQFLTPEALQSIEYCANRLPKEESVAEAELDEISQLVNELFEAVRASKLNPGLRSWLLHLLATMKRSIDYYWINGARGFRESLATVIGELQLQGNHIAQEDVGDGFGSKFVRLLKLLHSGAMKSKEWLPIIEFAKNNVPLLWHETQIFLNRINP